MGVVTCLRHATSVKSLLMPGRGSTNRWTLKSMCSAASLLNPIPTDLEARVLTTNIDLDEGTCSLDLLEAASEFFALTLPQARTIVKEVATVTATWRDTAKAVGARSAEINRMASAFEHDDLKRALAL